MIVLVILLGLLSTAYGGSSEMSSKPKSSTKTYNTVSFAHSQKPENYYHTTTQQTPQSFPYSFAAKPTYITPAPQQQQQQQQQQVPLQPTMLIIAHPALVPQSLLNQMGLLQHMVSYFHNNPQAKYQLLYGIQQQQQQQQQQLPHPTVQPYAQPISVPVYQQQSMTSPYQQFAAAPAHLVQPSSVHSQQQTPAASYGMASHLVQQPQAVPLDQISHLAQSVAQQYVINPGKGGAPPAIITGLENFSPEQQAQIKAQLGLGTAEQNDVAPQTTSSQNSKTTSSSANNPTNGSGRSSYFNH